MTKSVRIEYAGGCCHVMARGKRWETIFRDEADREFFLRGKNMHADPCFLDLDRYLGPSHSIT